MVTALVMCTNSGFMLCVIYTWFSKSVLILQIHSRPGHLCVREKRVCILPITAVDELTVWLTQAQWIKDPLRVSSSFKVLSQDPTRSLLRHYIKPKFGLFLCVSRHIQRWIDTFSILFLSLLSWCRVEQWEHPQL